MPPTLSTRLDVRCSCHRHVSPGDLAVEVVDPHDLAGLRRAVVEWLPPRHAREDEDAAALVVTELVGNGLRHGSPPVHVHLVDEHGIDPAVRIIVTDHGPGHGQQVQPPSLRDDVPSTEQVGGRGLWLVSQLAASVAVVAGAGAMTVAVLLPLHA